MKYDNKYLKEIDKWHKRDDNSAFLSRHPEIEKFDMPKTFYFRYLPERHTMHWAIIKPDDKFVNVYFINNWGRVFDKLEFKNTKIARRRLRKCGFDFSTNRYCPFTPPEPIYIQLSEGKKSAPYSKGNLFQSVQRSKKHINKIEKTYIKQTANYYERYKTWIYKEKVSMPADVHKIFAENDTPTAYKILIDTNNQTEVKQKCIKPDITKCSIIALFVITILILLVLIIRILGF